MHGNGNNVREQYESKNIAIWKSQVHVSVFVPVHWWLASFYYSSVLYFFTLSYHGDWVDPTVNFTHRFFAEYLHLVIWSMSIHRGNSNSPPIVLSSYLPICCSPIYISVVHLSSPNLCPSDPSFPSCKFVTLGESSQINHGESFQSPALYFKNIS